MSQYFESIRIQNRKAHLLPYHSARLNRTRQKLFAVHDQIDLNDWIVIPEDMDNSIWKCRVTYGSTIDKVTFEPYTGRSIANYQLVEVGPEFNYIHKGDRSGLQEYYNQRQSADDIIMVRNGYLTDSFWSNIILSQKGRWYTPSTPLLKGTMRLHLLNQGMITERIIRIADILTYDLVMPINALNPFDELRSIPTSQIKQ